jgi:uncharacterized membrane protein YjjB (DUF3815 family)
LIWQIIGAFIAVVAGSIFLDAPKKFIYQIGVVGALGWGIYLMFLDTLGPVISTFISGLVISTLSHIFSRIFKIPVTVFFIPGVFPLVPGSSMYLAVYNFIRGSGQDSQFYFAETIKISGMIALAIFTIDTVFNVITRLQGIRQKK